MDQNLKHYTSPVIFSVTVRFRVENKKRWTERVQRQHNGIVCVKVLPSVTPVIRKSLSLSRHYRLTSLLLKVTCFSNAILSSKRTLGKSEATLGWRSKSGFQIKRMGFRRNNSTSNVTTRWILYSILPNEVMWQYFPCIEKFWEVMIIWWKGLTQRCMTGENILVHPWCYNGIKYPVDYSTFF